MALKTGIFSLALGALLLGSNARADDQEVQLHVNTGETGVQLEWNSGEAGVQAYGYRRGYDQPYHSPGQDHVHSSHCHHGPQPTPPRNQHGRYELRLVQQWVPGRYEQVWVPEKCKYRPRWGTVKCRGGYYEQQWVEGHYETAEQWVWVPARRHRSTGPEWGSPVSYSY